MCLCLVGTDERSSVQLRLCLVWIDERSGVQLCLCLVWIYERSGVQLCAIVFVPCLDWLDWIRLIRCETGSVWDILSSWCWTDLMSLCLAWIDERSGVIAFVPCLDWWEIRCAIAFVPCLEWWEIRCAIAFVPCLNWLEIRYAIVFVPYLDWLDWIRLIQCAIGTIGIFYPVDIGQIWCHCVSLVVL